jgi:hypothetical protein
VRIAIITPSRVPVPPPAGGSTEAVLVLSRAPEVHAAVPNGGGLLVSVG